VSTASLVPETRGLSGEDAWTTLRRTGRRRLLVDAFARMRFSDGFSHARALAFMISLVAIQGIIAAVGLAEAIGGNGFADVVAATVHGVIPGPAGQALTAAITQAHTTASEHNYTALFLGTIGTLISATGAFGQLERALNRLYGVEQDRPSLQKYGRALMLALTAGTAATVAFLSLALGRNVFTRIASGTAVTVWSVARWPLGLVLIGAAVTILLRTSPRRCQPKLSWLAFGAGVAVTGCGIVTVALGVFFRVSRSFGQTYGPLAGMVALMLWAVLSSMVVIYGAAIAAQLEAVRSGAREPQDSEKVTESEPMGDRAQQPVGAR
jgi:YihY family inner membrane protein